MTPRLVWPNPSFYRGQTTAIHFSTELQEPYTGLFGDLVTSIDYIITLFSIDTCDALQYSKEV